MRTSKCFKNSPHFGTLYSPRIWLGIPSIITASSTRGGSDSTFAPTNVLQEGIYSYWAPNEQQSNWQIFLDMRKSETFNVLQVQEPIQMGQRVIEFHLDILKDGEWKLIINGTTIGYKRLLRFPNVKAQFLRFVIDKSRADPLVSYLGIYLDVISIMHGVPNASTRTSFNATQLIHPATSQYGSNTSMAAI